MATASKIKLDALQRPEFYVEGISKEAAETASALLQENHEKHHIFFNQSGFHNHIVHHLLTLFALNATPAELQKAYDENASYQRPPAPLDRAIVEDMHQPDKYKKYLGKEKYYHDFLVFFKQEMDNKGWQAVLNEYVFKGDARADDMLVRMFAGFLHPIIHLGFGVEFEQPAIIAEALAQACAHDTWMAPLFQASEQAARERATEGKPQKSVVELLHEIRADEKLRTAPRWGDGNKIRDGILTRAPDEMVKYASQYTVSEAQLEEKTAEMIHAAILFTATAQRPPKRVQFDFFYMHSANSSIFFRAFQRQPWLSRASKTRLLEWKVRADLAMYASRGAPALLLAELTDYVPRQDSGWAGVFERVKRLPDDGHASKLVRAVAHAEMVCGEGMGKGGLLIEGDMWRVLGHMVVDSVEVGEPHWVRGCGFEEAWREVPEREQEREPPERL